MPLDFDITQLEPMGFEDGEQITGTSLAMLIEYSKAISLKRIADALEREDIRTVEIKPEIIGEPMITLRATQFPPRPVREPANGDGDQAPKAKGRLHAALPATAIAAGFSPHDNSPTAPIDRNREVMIFHANGKQRRQFGGSTNWATKADDPWRVLGWRDLGDGALNAAGTGGE